MAIDVTTGKPRWSFQTVKKDVWDYDFGSQPTLIDYQGHAGAARRLEAGRSLCPRPRHRQAADADRNDQRRTAASSPAERAPRQTVSLWHTLRSPTLTESDMWGMSPIDQMICRIQYPAGRLSRLLHAAARGQVHGRYPGYNGGSDWGGVSVDPVRGIIIANYNDTPNYVRLVPREEADKQGIKPRFASQQLSLKLAFGSTRSGACPTRSRSTPAGGCRSPN